MEKTAPTTLGFTRPIVDQSIEGIFREMPVELGLTQLDPHALYLQRLQRVLRSVQDESRLLMDLLVNNFGLLCGAESCFFLRRFLDSLRRGRYHKCQGHIASPSKSTECKISKG